MTRLLSVLATLVCIPLLTAGSCSFDFSSLERSAKHVEDGLKGLDVLGLKKLLDDNEGLRKSLQEIQTKYSQYGAKDGIIVLKGQELLLRFKSRVGTIILNAYVDDESNILHYNRTISKGDLYTFWPTIPPMTLSNLGNPALISGEGYRAAAIAAFDKFLTTTSNLPLPDVSDKYLNENLRSVGVHRLIINAKPVTTIGNNWSLTGELLLRLEDKKERSLKEFTIDNNKPDQLSLLIEVKSQ
jgi:hypothetical protein